MERNRFWPILVMMLVFLGIILYLGSKPQMLSEFRKISILDIAYLLGLRLFFLISNGLLLREFAKKFEIKLAIKEWFGLSVVTTMGNYLTPFSGGMIARGAYLNKRYKFPYTHFMSLLIANYLINFFVIGIVGIFILLTIGSDINSFLQVLAFFIFTVVTILTLILLPVGELPWKNRAFKAINQALKGWKFIKEDYFLLSRLIFYALFNTILNGVSIWVAYSALEDTIFFGSAMLIGLLSSFSLLIRLTPGNLGIQEAVLGISSAILGLSAGRGLIIALLLRGAMVVLVFTLGPIFSFLLTQELIDVEFKE